MVITQSRSKRKPTGSRYKAYRAKRLYEAGGKPTMPRIDANKAKTVRTRGGSSKERMLMADTVNLLDQKTKKFEKVKITNVVESPSNKNYIRRNILTKGAIVETAKGKAKITSRPGQEGSVNAVLI